MSNIATALPDTIVFDIETKRGPREVGGWVPERMGLAVAVTWDESNGFREWFREDVKALIRELSGFSRVVGFNVLRFDYRVLARYQRNAPRLLAPKTVDILADVYQALGFRVSLDNVARATLGRGKIATADQAGKWWREGKRDLVAKYCRADVELTRDIYAYGVRHGVIYYPYYWIRLLPLLSTKRALSVDWEGEPARRRRRRHRLGSTGIMRQSVRSRNIRSIGYDDASQTLEIEFHSGGIYQYANVPKSVYDDLMHAPSHGSYFSRYIKGRYRGPRRDSRLVALARWLGRLRSEAP